MNLERLREILDEIGNYSLWLLGVYFLALWLYDRRKSLNAKERFEGEK